MGSTSASTVHLANARERSDANHAGEGFKALRGAAPQWALGLDPSNDVVLHEPKPV